MIESTESVAEFKHVRYASGELLSAGAKKWALALPPSDREFRRILSRNCFHHLLATLQRGIDHIGDFFEFGCE